MNCTSRLHSLVFFVKIWHVWFIPTQVNIISVSVSCVFFMQRLLPRPHARGVQAATQQKDEQAKEGSNIEFSHQAEDLI